VHAEPGAEERQGIELRGIGVSAGVVTGGVFRWNTEIELVAEYDLDEADLDAELGRFEQALDATRAQIHAIQQRVTDAIGVEGSQIFDAHILVVDDPVLTEEVRDRVRRERKNVECILNRVADRYVQALEAVDDDYLRDRASDIRDVTRRILRNLAGEDGHPGLQSASAAIVVAPDLLPSETAGLHLQAFIGIVTDLGSRTSHSAIMAQAMEIPAVVGLHDITSQVRPEDRLLIDGAQGIVIINPRPEQVEAFLAREGQRRAHQARLAALRDEPAETLDAYAIQLSANIEQVSDVDVLFKHGAQGVGLFRTEYLYLATDVLPDEDSQADTYAAIAARLDPHPFVIRTLDLGGDKLARLINTQAEVNPFMGWRAIRFCLDHPVLFKTQLRAILRASTHRNVRIMYPMVSNAQEVIRANQMLAEIKDELSAAGIPYNPDIEVGVMIEVPAAALTAELLVPHVRFFSLGTNDLVQYTLAVDRVNERVAHLYEPTHPAILKLIKLSIDVGHRNGIWITVCGEMAGNPMLALLLLGLGVDELSVSPPAVPLVKHVIRNVRYGDVEALAAAAMQSVCGDEVLDLCRELVVRTAPEVLDLL
jgi:phosphoenolpyruvate-protein phosphotransferase (PTS system enzyme I)